MLISELRNRKTLNTLRKLVNNLSYMALRSWDILLSSLALNLTFVEIEFWKVSMNFWLWFPLPSWAGNVCGKYSYLTWTGQCKFLICHPFLRSQLDIDVGSDIFLITRSCSILSCCFFTCYLIACGIRRLSAAIL